MMPSNDTNQPEPNQTPNPGLVPDPNQNVTPNPNPAPALAPIQASTSDPNLSFNSEPQNNPKRSMKKLLLVIAAVIVVATGATAYLAFGHKNKPNTIGGANADVYYNRTGYNRAKLVTGIGDPEAIIMKPVSTPVEYNGKPTLEACNLLSIDELHSAGYHLAANPIVGAITRSYFDGKGTGQLHLESSAPALVGTTDTNECQYGTQDQTAVTIDAYSTDYFSASDLQTTIDQDYTKHAPINGVDAYTYTGPVTDSTAYLLQYRNLAATVWFVFNSDSGQPTNNSETKSAQTLLGDIAKNLISQSSNMTGPAQVTYASPVFKPSFIDACSLIDGADFKAALGVDGSPIAQQQMAASTGVINFKDDGRPNKNFAYIDNECGRQAANSLANPSLGLSINTESFTTDTPAKYKFASDRQLIKNQTTISTKIGDENAIYGDMPDLGHALAFRKGRFIVDVSAAWPGLSTAATPQQYIQVLTPLAEKVAGELPNN